MIHKPNRRMMNHQSRGPEDRVPWPRRRGHAASGRDPRHAHDKRGHGTLVRSITLICLATLLVPGSLEAQPRQKHPVYVGEKVCASCHRGKGMGHQQCLQLLQFIDCLFVTKFTLRHFYLSVQLLSVMLAYQANPFPFIPPRLMP